MIIGFTQVTAYHYQDVLQSMHALRYRAFTMRRGYKTPTWQAMEYDLYDNLSSVYLVWRDQQHVVRGCCRLAPTDRSYMIRDLWPEMITEIDLPHSPFVWEASRLCVDHTLPAELRRDVINQLVCAYQQICLLNGIQYMVGVMAPDVWQRVFCRAGWDIEFIGPEMRLDGGETIVAGKMNVSEAILSHIVTTTGLDAPSLHITNNILGLLDDLAETEMNKIAVA
jgi:acyl homoserine lactone synthase